MTGESTPVIQISEVDELVRLAELRDVIFYEVSGKRSGNEDSEPQPFVLRSMFRHDATQLGTRFQVSVSGHGGDYIADAEAIFALSQPAEINPTALKEFIERVGVMVVYPFLREAVADVATRLSLRRPVLNLLRVGEARFSTDRPDGPDAD
jgi:hypothetical protein